MWINLLPFNIDNQRRAEAILEDKLNKPWRTMPSGRMTPKEALSLMLCLYGLALYSSLYLGGLRQSSALVLLGFGYNELNLADKTWFSRNAINALGFCCFTSGALEVTLGKYLEYSQHAQVLRWLGVIAAVVFTTVQMQDMADQEGDRLRNRRTMPLAIGDGMARWVSAVSMCFWSYFCPKFWKLDMGSLFCLGGFGMFVAFRTLAFRNVMDDERTFRLWNIWMAVLYSFPLVKVTMA